MLNLIDEQVLENVRFSVTNGLTIDQALGMLAIPDDQKERVRARAEQEIGLQVTVGPGIEGVNTFKGWLSKREIEWFYWNRLKSLLAREGKLPVGAVKTLDNVSTLLLDRMPPPDADDAFDWRGMVVGNVQSGKTATFTSLACKAADAGYRLIIVLSGMLNSLRLQTQLRISKEVLGHTAVGGQAMPPGKMWHPLTKDVLDGDWVTPATGVDLFQPGQTPSIAVVKKNVRVMEDLNEWFEDIQLRHPDLIDDLPVLVIDDESDEASIDTSKSKKPSSTNAQLRRLLGIFKRRVYLGFTATPYANCFIPDEKSHPDWGPDLYPKDFILPLKTSSAYTGGEKFFGRAPVWDGDKQQAVAGLLQVIPKDEQKLLIPPNGEQDSFEPQLTSSIREAVLSFILAGAARKFRGDGDEPCTMLIHLSRYKHQHEAQRKIVKDFLHEIYAALSLGNGRQRYLDELEALWDGKFRRTTKSLNKILEHDFSEIEKYLEGFVDEVELLVVNSESTDRVDFVREPGLKAIVIGGQNLGRGLTLEGLVTSFFMRAPANQSTAMQMQRWCGYRGQYLDLCRVYTEQEIADRYHDFLAIEAEMRDELFKFEQDKLLPNQVGIKLRQHPDVPLVSETKRGAMRKISGGYAGQLPQTTVFPMEDHDLLAANVKALNALVTDAKRVVGEPQLPGDGTQVWNGVTVSAVLDFFHSYKYTSRSSRSSFDSSAIQTYIREQQKQITKWTVVLCGIKDAGNGILHGLDLAEPVNRVLRTRVNGSDRLGVITDPKHEAIGLLDSKNTGADARKDRPAGNGLLLIYPIKHPDETEESGSLPTIVGVAISFSSNLKDKKGIHVAGSVALPEDEGEE